MDILYTVSNSSQWDDHQELKYSIRSFSKYYKDIDRIFVVGHKPKWLKNVVHIPMDSNIYGRKKNANIIMSIIRACSSNISGNFLYVSDDFFLTRDSYDKDFERVSNLGDYSKFSYNGNHYFSKCIDLTIKRLKRNKAKSFMNCESHGPCILNKKSYPEIMLSTKIVENDDVCILPFTYYYNKVKDIQFNFGNRTGFMNHKMDIEMLENIFESKQTLCITDGKLTSDIKDILRRRFPKKCRYEDTSKLSLETGEMAILAVYFNPLNNINMKYNFNRFLESFDYKKDLYVIELSFDGDFFVEHENVYKIRGDEKNILWQKECLLNILLKTIPKKYKYISWVDCDIIFDNNDWAIEAVDRLKKYNVVQLFEGCRNVQKDNSIIEVTSVISGKVKDNDPNGHTGFGWAIRRDLLRSFGFFEYAISGGSDTLMYWAFASLTKNEKVMKALPSAIKNEYNNWYDIVSKRVNGSISYVSGDITHLYHGTKSNRKYLKRHNIVKDIGLPKKDRNGLFQMEDEKVLSEFIDYLKSRKEDDNLIDINEYFDNIYVLNLDRSPQRLKIISSELERLGIKYERFSAIDGKNIENIENNYSLLPISPVSKLRQMGEIGNNFALACLMSQIDIIKDAKRKGYKRILIFEDDIFFHKNFNIEFQKFRNLKDWKLCYLGASQWDTIKNEYDYNFDHCNNTLGCFAYGIDESIYDEIIDIYNSNINSPIPIDRIMSRVQKNHYRKTFTLKKAICLPSVASSTIRESRNDAQHSKGMNWKMSNFDKFKIVQIGFNRCGTLSMNEFFKNNGLNCTHWDNGKLASKIHDNYVRRKPIISGYEDYDFISDMENSIYDIKSYEYFREINEQYPNTIFILNYRDVDSWVISRLKHNNGNYLSNAIKNYKTDEKGVISIWKEHYRKHINNVVSYFRDKDNLILFNLGKNDDFIEKISKYLVIKNPVFPKRNVSR